jgi:voltage-gated potassium channel
MTVDNGGDKVNNGPSTMELHSPTYNLFILALTIFSLTLMVVLLLPGLSTATRVTLQFIDTIICIVFLGDFLSNLRLAPNNRDYFLRQGGWLDLLGSIPSIPGLPLTAIFRLARLSRLTRIIRFLKAKDPKDLWADFMANRARSALLVTIFVAIVVITIASVVVLQVETRSPDANIVTGGDAFWWAFVTITTVGYGDQYPVSGLGRFMAMLLMIVGVAIFGVLTSYLSAAFIGPEDEEADDKSEARAERLEADMTQVKQELATIRQMLQEIKE